MFGAFVSLWHESPKAKGKLWLSYRCHDNGRTKFLSLEARFLLFKTQKIVLFEDYKSDSTSKGKWIRPFDKIKQCMDF